MKKIIFIILLLLFASCSNEDEQLIKVDSETTIKPLSRGPNDIPELITKSITNITPYGASSGAVFLDSLTIRGSYNEKGVCFSTSPNPTIADNTFKESDDSYYYNENTGGCRITYIKSLEPNTKYYVKSYITQFTNMTVGQTLPTIPIIYGNEISFITPSNQNLYLGKEFLGGYIAYIFTPGDSRYESATKPHGIILYKGITLGGAPWGCSNRLFPRNSSSPDMTKSIAQTCGLSTAAGLIYRLSKDNFNDWKMGSQNELGLIKVNLKETGIIKYTGSSWTTEEINAWDAKTMNFGTRNSSLNKSTRNGAMPIRYF